MALQQNLSDALTADHESSDTAQSIDNHKTMPINNSKTITDPISITGSTKIDQIIIELDPRINKIPESRIEEIQDIIGDYIFGRQFSALEIIRERTNQDVADFIEGISIITRENQIENITALQEYFIEISNSIDIEDICKE